VRSTTFLFTTLCTSIQLFGEKCSQSRVDRLKTSAAALQSAAGAPGTLSARSAPRAMLRQSRPPRHACGSFPTASRSGPWSPSRLPSLEREPSLPRRTASCALPGGPSCAPPARRACQGLRAHSEAAGPHRSAPEGMLPLPRPPIKATHRPAVPGLGTPSSCRSRAPPLL
jgi:hypothetical protein